MAGVLIVGLGILALGAWAALKGHTANGAILGTFGAIICLLGGMLMSAGVEFAPAKSEEACRAEFDCWSNQFQAAATKACAPQVEALAMVSHRWTDSVMSPKFPRASVSDGGFNITYVGDAIEFQNGLGAWIRHTYTCEYDTELNVAISVNAYPGRL